MGEKLHESDRLVIASQPVPADLAPLDSGAGRAVARVLSSFVPMSAEQRAEVRGLVASLPQEERTESPRLPSGSRHHLHVEWPGGIVMRLLANRNLSLVDVAKSVFAVTRGRRYWAASTYGRIGSGLKEVTPDLLGDLAPLLNIGFDDLAELTGVTPEETPDPEIGDLVWELRRLTGDQAEHVRQLVAA
ncbi:hypothetical protein ACWGE0_00845 [Lentzea sp. NPDC054927]